MDNYEKQRIDDKQRTVDLIESGIIRVSGKLITELADICNDERLTLSHIQALSDKLNLVLETLDMAQKDLDSIKAYYAEKDAERAEAIAAAQGA